MPVNLRVGELADIQIGQVGGGKEKFLNFSNGALLYESLHAAYLLTVVVLNKD